MDKEKYERERAQRIKNTVELLRGFAAAEFSPEAAAEIEQILSSPVEKTDDRSAVEYKEDTTMAKFVCNVCGYVYDEAAGDPDNGIAPGTKWEDVPDDFTCPLCGVGKEEFSAD